MKTTIAIFAYLAAVVAANLLTAAYGPVVSIINAFFSIGLVIVLRDVLHEAWAGDGRKMFALIATGAALSALLSPGSRRVALASCIAFAVSEAVDFLVYSRTRGAWATRSNKSNLPAALVDSLLFPTIAFGGFSMTITGAQFAAKVAGGFLFSLLLSRKMRRFAAVTLAIALASSSASQAQWLADVGAGFAKTEGLSAEPVVEVFVATPAWNDFRLYATLSWAIESDGTEPDVAILAVTRGVARGDRFWLAANAGAAGFAFDDFSEAHPFVGATAGVVLSRRLNLVGIYSLDLDSGGSTGVVKLAVPIIP